MAEIRTPEIVKNRFHVNSDCHQNHQISDNLHGVEISGFSVTQILHEIKSAFFANLRVLNG